ncbi:MAG: hypothetical protein LAN59_05030 [Acidobacteriia bacterium]|nr:hypothetical protein [Terriglobia bacterium]
MFRATAPQRRLDALPNCVYIRIVPAKKILLGQVWKKSDTGDSYLVTKLYSEALTSYAVLRKAGAEQEAPLRIKVVKTAAGAELPGFTFTQESESF